MSCMLLNVAMDSKEIRRLNLNALKGAQESITEFANRMETSRSSISDMLSGKRLIGDVKARRLEALAGKDRGWLDIVHEDEQKQEIREDILELAKRLATATEDQVQKFNALLTVAGIEARVPDNVIHIPQDALIVTEPKEKNLINTFRSVSNDGKYMIDAAARAAKDHYTLPEELHNRNSGNGK